MLTAAPCILSMQYCTTFRSGNARFTLPNLTLWKSLWSTAIYGSVIQQRVYQPQLYNANEVKCAYGVARWHWLKHYWQCNRWVALAPLNMSAAHNRHYEQRDSINIHSAMWHETFNFFNVHDTLWSSVFCNSAWNRFSTSPKIVQQHI